jgi:hypothetical protein
MKKLNRNQTLFVVITTVAVAVSAYFSIHAGVRVMAASNGIPGTITTQIESASLSKGMICVNALPNIDTYSPDEGIKQYCAKLNEVIVTADNAEGTQVKLSVRTHVPNLYGLDSLTVIDKMEVFVGTEAERKQWNSLILASRGRYFGPRSVQLFDGDASAKE